MTLSLKSTTALIHIMLSLPATAPVSVPGTPPDAQSLPRNASATTEDTSESTGQQQPAAKNVELNKQVCCVCDDVS